MKKKRSFFVKVIKCSTQHRRTYTKLVGKVFEVVNDKFNSEYYNFYPKNAMRLPVYGRRINNPTEHYGLLKCDCEKVDPKTEDTLNIIYKMFKQALPTNVPGHMTARKLNSLIRIVTGAL